MTAAPDRLDGPLLVYVVGRVDQGIRRELRTRLRDWELSVPQFTAVSILARGSGLSNAQLARRCMVTPQTMIESLSELEARGLVVRTSDPDRRVLRAELTASGRRLVAAIEPTVTELSDEILHDVSPEHRAVVLEAMISAMERLRAGLPQSHPSPAVGGAG